MEFPTGARMQAWLEQAWLERYLSGALTEAENDAFEAYALDKTDLVRQIEMDTDLRAAFARARQAAQSGSGKDVQSDELPGSSRMPGGGPRYLALAASAVLALGLGWAGGAKFGPSGSVGDTEANPTRLVFRTMRGSELAAYVDGQGTPTGPILVEVALPSDATTASVQIGAARALQLDVSEDGYARFLMARDLIASSVVVRYLSGGSSGELKLDIASELSKNGR